MGGASKDAKGAEGGGASADTDLVDEVTGPLVAKPGFKLGEQADPVRDAIQAEAVALFEAGAYDDAGEKFYYLAEAAHNANDPQQECTALQNMGTSLVMMGLHFEASRCYESAIKLAIGAGSVSSQCEVLECLIWVHSERGDFGRAIECVGALRSLHEQADAPDPELLCSDAVSAAGMHAHLREWAEAKTCYEEGIAIARKLPEAASRQKWLGRACIELAQACVQLGELDEALALYAEALREAVEAKDEEKQMRTHANIAIVHKLNRDLDKAINHLDSASAYAHVAIRADLTLSHSPHPFCPPPPCCTLRALSAMRLLTQSTGRRNARPVSRAAQSLYRCRRRMSSWRDVAPSTTPACSTWPASTSWPSRRRTARSRSRRSSTTTRRAASAARDWARSSSRWASPSARYRV